jgi:hypothetical protein
MRLINNERDWKGIVRLYAIGSITAAAFATAAVFFSGKQSNHLELIALTLTAVVVTKIIDSWPQIGGILSREIQESIERLAEKFRVDWQEGDWPTDARKAGNGDLQSD